MKRLDYKTLIVEIAIVLVLVVLYHVFSIERKHEVAMVQSVNGGEEQLSCQFVDGWHDIAKEYLKNYEDTVWYFNNGYSTQNCKLKEDD